MSVSDGLNSASAVEAITSSPRVAAREDRSPEILDVQEFAPPPERIIDVIDFDAEGRLPPFPGVRRPLRSAVWIIRGLFGLASLLVLLAFIAAIPIVNFLALGYLLEVEGRVARSGRLRDGFPLLGLAPRLGSIALGVYLWLLPLRLIATNADAAHIVDPGSAADIGLQTLRVIAAVGIGVHLALALARGGSLGCFVRPLKNLLWFVRRIAEGNYLDLAERRVSEFVAGLRLKHHFLLGVRGFLTAAIWLVLPTLVYASVNQGGAGGGLRMFFGGILLVLAFAWVPFLQARFAAENRWRAGLELRQVRDLFAHAPFAWLLAVVVTYLLALPLYLVKAFVLPPDALWPITLIFVASIYPTKLVTGWAYHRAVRRRREGKRSWFATRLLVRLVAMLPLLGLYVFLLYFTQFLGAHGKLTLFEHHVFLLPWPNLLGAGG